MTANLPQIYFYFSQYEWLSKNMPESADIYQPSFHNSFHKQGISDGEVCWILQTYLRLRDNGFSCELTGTMPTEGIVIAYRMSLPFNFKPTPKLLIICLKADKPPHPYAQLHVVQNSYERKLIENAYLMPHWPQQGLIPRDPARGDRFETVAYLGTGGNLASELISPAWREQLNQMGA
jgi:hypothetical protein